ISPSFSGICGSKFSKIFARGLDRGDTISVRNYSPPLRQARVARENHLTSFPRKLENEVLRNPIKVPEGELLRDRAPKLLLRVPRSIPPLPRRNCKLSLKLCLRGGDVCTRFACNGLIPCFLLRNAWRL